VLKEKLYQGVQVQCYVWDYYLKMIIVRAALHEQPSMQKRAVYNLERHLY
jgi:hypothetical protein